jgi:hypothetical protein
VVVILGLYMLLWGKDKDQQYNASSEERVADLDCEMQRANITNVSPGKSGSEEDSNTTRQEGIYCHSHE